MFLSMTTDKSDEERQLHARSVSDSPAGNKACEELKQLANGEAIDIERKKAMAGGAMRSVSNGSERAARHCRGIALWANLW